MSISVVLKGDTLLMKGYGYADLENQVRATEHTVYRIGSITKQFTAAAIMKLVEQGKISLSDPLSKYLKKYPETGSAVTIHQLLNHTSGIPSFTSMGPAFWSKARLDLSHNQVLQIFQEAPLQFPSGARYSYSNSGYYLLGLVIEQASGASYSDFLENQFFEPLQLESTLYCGARKIIPNRARGYGMDNGEIVNAQAISMNPPFAAGALCSTVLDLMAWTKALVSGRAVTESSYKKMSTETQLADGTTHNYGYGLDTGERNGHAYIAHGGGIDGFTTYLSHYPDQDLTIAVLLNSENGTPLDIERALAEAILTTPSAGQMQ